MMASELFATLRFCPIESACRIQSFLEKRNPIVHGLARSVIHQSSNRLRSELQEVLNLKQREAADANGRIIHQWIGVLQVTFDGGFERRNGAAIKTNHEFLRRWSGQNFVKENLQVRIGHGFQPKRRLAHLTDSLAQRGSMF